MAHDDEQYGDQLRSDATGHDKEHYTMQQRDSLQKAYSAESTQVAKDERTANPEVFNHGVRAQYTKDVLDDAKADVAKTRLTTAQSDATAVRKPVTDSLQTAVDTFEQSKAGDYKKADASHKKYDDIKSGKLKQTVGSGKSIIDRD